MTDSVRRKYARLEAAIVSLVALELGDCERLKMALSARSRVIIYSACARGVLYFRYLLAVLGDVPKLTNALCGASRRYQL